MNENEYVALDAIEPIPPGSTDATMGWKLIGGVTTVAFVILLAMLMLYIVGARNNLKMERWYNREQNDGASTRQP